MNIIYSNMSVPNDQGEPTDVKVLLALYDESATRETANGTVTGKMISAVDFLSNGNLLRQYTYMGYNLKFAKVDGVPNPLILITGSIPAEVNALGIDSVYGSVEPRLNDAGVLPPDISEKFISVLVNQGFTQAIAKLIILCCYAKKQLLTVENTMYPNVDASLIAEPFAAKTRDWINEVTRKNTMAAIPDNETKFQDSCTSELFIRLPAHEAMFNYLATDEDESEQQEVRDLHSFMPVRDEVSVPYSGDPRNEDPDYVQSMIENPSIATSTILKTIIGQSENNTDTLYDNEQRFYEALNTWMGLIAANEDPTHEDTGELCALSLDYLHTLAETLYIWYWQHNRRVPCKVEIGTGENLDESRYTFKSEDHMGVAPDDLIQFLDRASADLGREAYAKAIIQLARWGSRKPNAIVFDGYDKCFDLNLGRVKAATPSLAKYDKVQSNGHDYKFVGVVIDSTNIADPRIGFKNWPMPVGVAISQVYCDKSTNETLELMFFASMIDAVRGVVTGKLDVDGLSWTAEEGWRVSDSITNYTMDEVLALSKMPDQMAFPIVRGQGLIQIYSDLRIPTSSNTDTHFSIMCSKVLSSKLLSFIDSNMFDTYAAFDALTKNGKPGRKQAADYMIVRDLLKVYHEAAVMYSTSAPADNSGLMQLWHQAILESGYVDEAYFYKGVSRPSEPLPGCKIENFNHCFWHSEDSDAATQSMQVPQQMPLGNQSTAQSAQPVTPVQQNVPTSTVTDSSLDLRSTIIEQPVPDCSYMSFVNASGKAVCVCAINPRFKTVNGVKRPNPTFVVLDSQTVSQLNLTQVRETQPITKLLTHMCKVFFTMAKNKPSNSNLRFNSTEAIGELHAYFKELG